MTPAQLERFQAKIVDLGHCWAFRACLNNTGYCAFGMGAGPQMAHRVAYEHWIGPIPEGHDIHHTCTHRWCVNPAHLQPLTHRENLLADDTIVARQAAQTHCLRGHEYTPENTYRWRNKRQCKTCSITLRRERRTR